MIKILIYFRNIRHSDSRNYEVTVIFVTSYFYSILVCICLILTLKTNLSKKIEALGNGIKL